MLRLAQFGYPLYTEKLGDGEVDHNREPCNTAGEYDTGSRAVTLSVDFRQ